MSSVERVAIDEAKLAALMQEAKQVYDAQFDGTVWFERSIFTNWTCAIADCKYCYLSTKPKHTPGSEAKALRSKESIIAEALVCKALGWKVGYITGGLRVERTEYLVDLLADLESALGEKVAMNFGPYTEKEILALKPHLGGMGCAIESFDEELHNHICPSKPLKSLLRMLDVLKREQIPKLITIILGLGEGLEDIDRVIENIKKYSIETVQLCFLKPQAGTEYATVPPPDAQYMAYWIASLRIGVPNLKIKVALVDECLDEFGLLLEAGANCFSRFMVFKDFGSEKAEKIIAGTAQAGRRLVGEFRELPSGLNAAELVAHLPFEADRVARIEHKLSKYLKKLGPNLITIDNI